MAGVSTPSVCISVFSEKGWTAIVILGCGLTYEYGSTSADMSRPKIDSSISPIVTRSVSISTSTEGAAKRKSVVSAATPSSCPSMPKPLIESCWLPSASVIVPTNRKWPETPTGSAPKSNSALISKGSAAVILLVFIVSPLIILAIPACASRKEIDALLRRKLAISRSIVSPVSTGSAAGAASARSSQLFVPSAATSRLRENESSEAVPMATLC